jgi:hypothetical protein
VTRVVVVGSSLLSARDIAACDACQKGEASPHHTCSNTFLISSSYQPIVELLEAATFWRLPLELDSGALNRRSDRSAALTAVKWIPDLIPAIHALLHADPSIHPPIPR